MRICLAFLELKDARACTVMIFHICVQFMHVVLRMHNKHLLYLHYILCLWCWQDYHQYYNSSFISNNEFVGHQYWVNMTDRSDVQVNDMLSQSHRRAAVSESVLAVGMQSVGWDGKWQAVLVQNKILEVLARMYLLCFVC
jgi:hypothetical protein